MQQKWTVLSEKLNAEAKKSHVYNTARLTPRALSGRYYARRAVIRETSSVIGGSPAVQAYAALWRTNCYPGWYELGTVWVGPNLRGNGLYRDLMKEAASLAPTSANLFLITREQKIMRTADELGFKRVTTQTHPHLLLWASHVGIVCRLPTSIHPVAPGEWKPALDGERSLFFRGA